MKVLIVDNEKHVIDAIRMIINWSSYGITEVYDACDGKEATEIVKEKQPDIVLTDMMMPNMHGKQLVTWISQHTRVTQVIVISGYSDFNYVQHAIRHGGVDYITKPIDVKQLEKAMGLAVKKVMKEKEQTQLILNHYKKEHVYWDKLFLNMLHVLHPIKTEVDDIKKRFDIPDTAPVFVLTARIDGASSTVKKQFAGHMQTLYFALTNICREWIAIEHLHAYAFFDNTDRCSVKVIFWESDNRMLHFIQKYCKTVKRLYKSQLFCGLSQEHDFKKRIYRANCESEHALEQRNLNDNQTYLTTYKRQFTSERNYFQSIKMDLAIAFSLGQSKKVAKYVSAIFDDICQEDYFSVGMLMALIDEYKILRVYLLETLLKDSNSLVLDERVTSLKHIENHPLEDVKAFMIEDLVTLCKYLHDYNNLKKDLVYIIVNYMNEHYTETISLQDIARKFYLSKEHLSRNFRKKIGVTVTEYITNLRMNKAKELLQIQHLKIKEIANQVGYEDEKYFSKVFRHKFSVTPKNFRKKL